MFPVVDYTFFSLLFLVIDSVQLHLTEKWMKSKKVTLLIYLLNWCLELNVG